MQGFTWYDFWTRVLPDWLSGVGTVGAVIVALWLARRGNSVRLRVVPKIAFPVGGIARQPHRLCIEVTNLSTFPVTITEVGVLYQSTTSRGQLVQPLLYGGESLPHRLAARTSVTAYADPGALRGNHLVRCAYAATDCGVTATGDSTALHELARQENADA